MNKDGFEMHENDKLSVVLSMRVFLIRLKCEKKTKKGVANGVVWVDFLWDFAYEWGWAQLELTQVDLSSGQP